MLEFMVDMVNSKKMAIVLLGLLALSTAQAVQVTNNTSQPITLCDFTFISGIEFCRFPVTLQPDEMFAEDDIASFSLKISDTIIDSFENLKDSTQIFITFHQTSSGNFWKIRKDGDLATIDIIDRK